MAVLALLSLIPSGCGNLVSSAQQHLSPPSSDGSMTIVYRDASDSKVTGGRDLQDEVDRLREELVALRDERSKKQQHEQSLGTTEGAGSYHAPYRLAAYELLHLVNSSQTRSTDLAGKAYEVSGVVSECGGFEILLEPSLTLGAFSKIECRFDYAHFSRYVRNEFVPGDHVTVKGLLKYMIKPTVTLSDCEIVGHSQERNQSPDRAITIGAPSECSSNDRPFPLGVARADWDNNRALVTISGERTWMSAGDQRHVHAGRDYALTFIGVQYNTCTKRLSCSFSVRDMRPVPNR